MAKIGEFLENMATNEIIASLRDTALDFRDSIIDDGNERDDPQDPDAMRVLKTPYRTPRIPSTVGNYAYEPMTNNKENIRLLLLAPGVGLDDILISLDEFSIECEPEYEAISYQWGDPSLCRVVRCNDKAMHITENLFAALSRFRRPKTARLLWADAVCINQGDDTEKSNQVQLMEKIYSNAKNVLGWLGYATPSLPRGVSLIYELLRYHGKDGKEATFMNSTTRAAHLVKQRDFDALSYILSRPWYRRVWVQQEIVLPVSFDLHYGPDVTISAETVFAICRCLFEREGAILHFNLHQKARAGVRHIMGLERMRLQSRQRDLHSMLMTIRPCIATDPRDKVFGILSLCDSNVRENLKPDYTSSVPKIYIRATKYLLEADLPPSDIFDSLGGTQPDLPSWIPDWSQPQPPGMSIGQFGRFAAGGAKRFIPAIIEFNDKPMIAARGRCVDSLKFLCDLNKYITTSIINQGKYYEEHVEVNLKRIICKIMEFAKDANLKNRNEAWVAVRAGGSNKDQQLDIPHGKSSDRIPQWWNNWKAFSRGDKSITRWGLDAGYLPSYSSTLSNTAPLNFLREIMLGRKFVLTGQGNLGWVPECARKGDVVAVLEGSNFPLVLRRDSPDKPWRIIGACYIHGVMHGEAWKGFEAQAEDIMIE